VDAPDPFDLEETPRLPADPRRYGIGIVGAGGIVESAHLPAYRKAGFRVEAIYDLDPAKARRLADQFGIPRPVASLDELLDRPEIAIVDIAIPAWAQPEVARRAIGAGKHLLCQKPFAESYPEALGIVRAAEDAGVRIAVNQNMRFSPLIRAARTLVERGWLGQLVSAEIQVNVKTPWDLWGWILALDRLEIMYHSIHYLDALRTLLGDPSSVYCRGQGYPGQKARGETRTTTLLEYPDERWGLVRAEHNNPNDARDWSCSFRLEGTGGTAKGTFGALFDYPTGRPDTIRYRSMNRTGDAWVEPSLEGRWFPDGFVGTMAGLMRALDEGREPGHSGRDNLQTLALVFAAYRSMADHRPVNLEPVMHIGS
jgi:predicted dehydrogenase